MVIMATTSMMVRDNELAAEFPIVRLNALSRLEGRRFGKRPITQNRIHVGMRTNEETRACSTFPLYSPNPRNNRATTDIMGMMKRTGMVR
jgi:hypothetical protein